MNRRAFVTGLGAVLAAPLAAEAQPARIPRVGVLSPTTTDDLLMQAFERGLSEQGYVADKISALRLGTPLDGAIGCSSSRGSSPTPRST